MRDCTNLLASLVDEQVLIKDIEGELKNLENLFADLKEAQMLYLKATESGNVIKEKDFLLKPSKSMGESQARAGKQQSFRVLQAYNPMNGCWKLQGGCRKL